MAGFFSGLGAGIAGAGQAAAQYGQQQRNIEAQQNLLNMQIWNESRNKIADEIQAHKNEQQGQTWANFDKLEKQVRLARPGDDLSKLIGDVQANTTIHPSSIQAMQGAGLIQGEPPQQQPGPAQPGTVPGSLQAPLYPPVPQQSGFSNLIASAGATPPPSAPPVAAQPANNPITDVHGPIEALPSNQSMVPGIIGARNLLTQPAASNGTNASQPSTFIPNQRPPNFDAMQFFPMTDNDRAIDTMYKQGLLGGHIAPQVAAGYTDLQRRREEFAGGFAKADAQYAMNMAHAAQTLSPDQLQKLKAEQLTELAQTGTIKPLVPLKPGEEQRSVTGELIARNEQPRLENLAPGASLVSVPASGDAASASGIQTPPSNIVASSPPLLDPAESRAVSASAQTAAKYGLPFNKDLNPRRPLDQLPLKYQTEAAGLAATMNADPMVRASLEESRQMNRQLEGLRMQMLQGTMPTPKDINDTASDILGGKMAPSQLRTLAAMGQSGAMLRQGVTRAIHDQNPDFNFEAAESNYNFGHSPAFQQTTRYMDYADSTIDNTIKNANVLANSNFTSFNKLKNAVKGEFQNVDLARFNTDRLETADAIAKILQGGTGSGTSDKKLSDAQGILRESDSPQKVATTLKEVRDLIAGRKKAYTAGTYLDTGKAPILPAGIPKPGESFAGGKVLNVEKVQ